MIARRGDPRGLEERVCTCGSWSAQPKAIVQSVGGQRDSGFTTSVVNSYHWSACQLMSVSHDKSKNTCPAGNQSHLGHLDFLSERHGDGANFCVFIAEKDGESE